MDLARRCKETFFSTLAAKWALRALICGANGAVAALRIYILEPSKGPRHAASSCGISNVFYAV